MPSLREGRGNVADRDLGVPAVVEVHGERPQAELLHFVGDVRAVDAAADADDAVVALAAPSRRIFDDGVFELRWRRRRRCGPTAVDRRSYSWQ